MTNKTFSNVASLMESLGDGATAQALKEQMSQRHVVAALQAMRVSKHISQTEIAAALGCTQGRISKLETGVDGNLTLDDIEAYAKALDCSVSLVFSQRKQTAVDRVKGYASLIRSELKEIAKCAHKDEHIAQAVSKFFGEALFNLVEFVRDASTDLPRKEDGEPYITIKRLLCESEEQVSDDSDCCTSNTEQPSASA